MSKLTSRLKRLEDPRTPGQRKREEEMTRKRRETTARIEQQYARRAEEWPQGFEDLLQASEELESVLEAEGLSLEKAGHHELRHPNSPVGRAVRKYQNEQDRFWHGYTCGMSCEDCGRAGELSPRASEGECKHCGAVVGSNFYFYKRVRSLEGLKADIAASRRMGHDALGEAHERLLLRRVRDVGS